MPAGGVRRSGALGEVPFVFCEAWVVFGVDDGEFCAGEWDSAEWVAVAEAAIEQDQPNKWLGQRIRDVNDDVDNDAPFSAFGGPWLVGGALCSGSTNGWTCAFCLKIRARWGFFGG